MIPYPNVQVILIGKMLVLLTYKCKSTKFIRFGLLKWSSNQNKKNPIQNVYYNTENAFMKFL